MTLTIPLTVRVGNKHITHEVTSLSFREDAIGGIQNITLRLSRPLDRFDTDVAAFAQVYVYDKRTAETIATGRISDTGRGVSPGDGQQWDITCFGAAQHPSDITAPYIVVDTRQDTFARSAYSTHNATTGTDERDEDTPSLMLSAEEGKAVSTSWVADMICRTVRAAGMKLGRVRAEWDSGVTSGDFVLQLVTRDGSGGGTVAATANSNTAGGVMAGKVVTDFSNGHDTVSVRAVRNTSSTTGTEAMWFEFYNVVVRTLLLNADGTEITSGYTTNTVLAHEVVNDLLGRMLPDFDGTLATVDDTAAYTIDQLAYPDGVTPAQVLDDLMILEPAFRWTVSPDGTVFSWEPWPTTVRYEVTLEDGGGFPVSTQDLASSVMVRWKNPNGRVRTTVRTEATTGMLTAAGLARQVILDAGDETGSLTAATRIGDNYLTDHAVPANAGTLTVSRPILDLLTGRMVEPFEIRAGSLIRVRGVESYPDALNASSSDGQTVFRIWSKTYNSDSHTAQLELDTYSRKTANALIRLLKQRRRRR